MKTMKKRTRGAVAGLVAGVATVSLLSLGSGRAHAFCGFYVGGSEALYNDATMVVMMREGTRTVLSMQNAYQGPAADFALVVPVPVVLQEENVKTLPRDVFGHVDRLAAPRLVEYWEQDPCRPMPDPERMTPTASAMPDDAPMKKPSEDLGVKIEAQFTVGEYEIVILSANDSQGLDTWLRQEKYNIPAGAGAVLKPYVAAGMKFFVAKVDVEKVTMADGRAVLSPLRFHYDSEKFELPVRLGLLNSAGTQDLIVHILARGQRYEVANYQNVFIPTNLAVAEKARDKFAPLYAALFDATLAKHPGAVVTEYSWDAGSCDPCPTPPLDGVDLVTLGADALPSFAQSQQRLNYGGGFVLTRMHARYGKEALGEDLVFKEAGPVMGGREVWSYDEKGTPRTIEEGATPTGTNNFQARYIIRHPWTGAVSCAHPRRGIWGAPPDGKAPPEGSGPPKAATDLASAPRGGIKLASYLKQDVPALGLKAAAGAAEEPPAIGAAPDGGTPRKALDTGGATEKKKGCGCEAAGRSEGLGGALLIGLAALVTMRERKQKQNRKPNRRA